MGIWGAINGIKEIERGSGRGGDDKMSGIKNNIKGCVVNCRCRGGGIV